MQRTGGRGGGTQSGPAGGKGRDGGIFGVVCETGFVPWGCALDVIWSFGTGLLDRFHGAFGRRFAAARLAGVGTETGETGRFDKAHIDVGERLACCSGMGVEVRSVCKFGAVRPGHGIAIWSIGRNGELRTV